MPLHALAAPLAAPGGLLAAAQPAPAAPAITSLPDLLPALVVDLLALALSYRRHRRADLVVLYATFNVGLFAAVVVIAAGEVAAAVGFGLFAVLSIIRLRGEPLANEEIAYFFAAVVLGLATAVDLGTPLLTAGLAALVVAVPAVADHPRAFASQRRLELVLEVVFADDDALRRHLAERLGARIVDVEVLELDYVRETTRVRVRATPRARESARGEDDGAVAALAR